MKGHPFKPHPLKVASEVAQTTITSLLHSLVCKESKVLLNQKKLAERVTEQDPTCPLVLETDSEDNDPSLAKNAFDLPIGEGEHVSMEDGLVAESRDGDGVDGVRLFECGAI